MLPWLWSRAEVTSALGVPSAIGGICFLGFYDPKNRIKQYKTIKTSETPRL